MIDLQNELWDYQGALNERHQGLHTKIPPKPEPLVRYEQIKSLNVPYCAGGLEDQPYLWMLEHAVVLSYLQQQQEIEDQNNLMQALQRAKDGKSNPNY